MVWVSGSSEMEEQEGPELGEGGVLLHQVHPRTRSPVSFYFLTSILPTIHVALILSVSGAGAVGLDRYVCLQKTRDHFPPGHQHDHF